MADTNIFNRMRKRFFPNTYDKLERVINKRNEAALADGPTRQTLVVKSKSMASVFKALKSTVLTAFAGGQRGMFQAPEWDFSKVQIALSNESIFRRSVEKYVEQIRKQRWEFVGNNPNTVKYIRRRFAQIATVQDRTTSSLWDEIAFNLVLYNNVIIAKRRNTKASGGKLRKTFDGKVRVPVAGYEVIDAATIEVDKDKYGNVNRWKQNVNQRRGGFWEAFRHSDADSPKWAPYNIIHIKDFSTTPSQYFFAMPMSIPVLADMEALRELEELTLLESVKIAVPKLHGKVGSKEIPGTPQDIKDLASQIEAVPADGVFVTSERVDIKSIIAQAGANNILNSAVDYFKARVLAGLGMSAVAMGEGDSSNRSTAQVISSEMQSTSAKFQRILKTSIEHHIIKELLFEQGYTISTLDDESMVYLSIPEIDLTEKIKREAHSLQQYLSNAITEDELRKELGRDIIEEAQRDNLYINTVQIPLVEAEAGASAEAAENSSDNTTKPTNQYGTQLAKPKIAKDYYNLLWDSCLRETTKDGVIKQISGSRLEARDITSMKLLLNDSLKSHELTLAVGSLFSAFEGIIVKE